MFLTDMKCTMTGSPSKTPKKTLPARKRVGDFISCLDQQNAVEKDSSESAKLPKTTTPIYNYDSLQTSTFISDQQTPHGKEKKGTNQ